MQEPIDTFATDQDALEPAARQDARADRRHRGIRFEFGNGATPLKGYTIKRGVGVGGFGDVYYAVSDAGKDVAIKRIQRNLDVELRGVRQCLNLKHPNLVALYDVRYDEDESPWVVMEYVAGESLQQVIDRNPNGLPLDQVNFWFAGLASGIGYLHDCGVVHRDIKPANLFLDEGTVKIGDYGLSKFISCSRRSGQTQSVGTFHYMAPEIGQGRYGKEIDVYALGIVLYEMLSGRVPFDGESSQEIIMKHLTSTPHLDDVPTRYQAAIAGALRKDPDQRTHSVGDMCCQLQLPCGSPNPLKPSQPAAVNSDDGIILAESVDKVRPPAGAVVAAVSPASTPPPQPASQLPEEPIARAVCSMARNARDSWNRLTTPQRVLLVVLIVLFLGSGIVESLPLLFTLCGAYGVYYLIRSLVLMDSTTGKPPASRAAQAAAGVGQAAVGVEGGASKQAMRRKQPAMSPARRRKLADQRMRKALVDKPVHQHLIELSGAYLLAAFTAAAVSFVIQLFITQDLGAPLLTWAPVAAWMACVTTLIACAILTVAKFWEGSTDGAGLRRLTLLIVGLALGLIAWALSQWLMVAPPNIADIPRSDILPAGFFGHAGLPLLPAYLVFFAGLLAIPRWWKQADPLRRKRLSLWTVGTTTLWILCFQIACSFPQGFLLAGTVAAAVQVAAPWLDSDKRTALSENLETVA